MSDQHITVAALYCEKQSIYHTIPGVDVYDEKRDARTYDGEFPVVAHPPCRLWSRMKFFSTADLSEKYLAFHALEQVRRCGGVLEHPVGSSFWPSASLPTPGQFDQYGFTTVVDQWWFGHRARKRTLLYMCGVDWAMIPPLPLVLGVAECVLAGRGKPLPKRLRSSSPEAFAKWLVCVARQVVKLVKS